MAASSSSASLATQPPVQRPLSDAAASNYSSAMFTQYWSTAVTVFSQPSFIIALLTLPLTYLYYTYATSRPPRIYHRHVQHANDKGDESCRICQTIAQSNLRSCLSASYRPTPFLFNGHLQTVFTGATVVLGVTRPHVKYARELFQVSATAPFLSGTVAIDWALTAAEQFTSHTPTVIIMHGLAGGSEEYYVRTLVHHMTSVCHYRCVVLNSRGCGNSTLSSAQAYCGAYTDDIRQSIAHIARRLPQSPLIGVGYSLGANILTKFVGEEKDECLLSAAVSLGNPFDLLWSSRMLDHQWITRLVYSPVLAQNMIKLVRVHQSVFAGAANIDIVKTLRSKTLREFDNAFTAKSFHFATADTYYRTGSSAQYVHDIRIPFVAVNALDDPICHPLGIPFDESVANPHVLLLTTKHGGHSLNWFTGWTADSWVKHVVANFSQSLLQVLRNDDDNAVTAMPIAHPPPQVIPYDVRPAQGNDYEDVDDIVGHEDEVHLNDQTEGAVHDDIDALSAVNLTESGSLSDHSRLNSTNTANEGEVDLMSFADDGEHVGTMNISSASATESDIYGLLNTTVEQLRLADERIERLSQVNQEQSQQIQQLVQLLQEQAHSTATSQTSTRRDERKESYWSS